LYHQASAFRFLTASPKMISSAKGISINPEPATLSSLIHHVSHGSRCAARTSITVLSRLSTTPARTTAVNPKKRTRQTMASTQ